MPHANRLESNSRETLKSLNGSRVPTAPKISDYFGCNVFGPETMKLLLPRETYRKLQDSIQNGKRVDIDVANSVASAMKNWAVSKGATHYCHWFQPMTGVTAEKHDSFIEPVGSGKVLESLLGKQLVQQEPDASSFPSGGLRTTFEARGYTAWDPTSPAFLMDSPGGATLCIPTIFVSYRGDSLDTKTPLLRSLDVLGRSALDLLKFFDATATKVYSTLGAEQEYFLIDRGYYEDRTDLLLTGRTLFGAPSPKGQQLEDQYFGSIRERVFECMTDAESELYKLGVPLKTRHNEVAPNQFECAPIYEETNVAVDHNQMVMDILKRVAARHGLACLLYEKPFAGINGSGKHCNWSLSTDTGKNILSPGETPHENLQFLTFLVSIIKAIKDHSALLRASIASSGNDHRLGANEAPPAIMSVFLGEQLTRVLEDLEKGITSKETEPEWMHFGLDRIPSVLRDNTDRNRTSPFAFTGNKFEFRAVGSAFNNAVPLTILNAIVANQLIETKKEIDAQLKAKKPLKVAVLEVVRKMYKEGKAVCFEGNNYSSEWVTEAKKRGLPNIMTTPHALEAWRSKKSIEMMGRIKVLSETEVESRYHVLQDKYWKEIDIEAKTMIEMAQTLFIPAAISYQTDLADSVAKLKKVGGKKELPAHFQKELLKKVVGLIEKAQEQVWAFKEPMEKAASLSEARELSYFYCDEVKPLFAPLRETLDQLEGLVPDHLWPVPKYREMLFLI